jgi:hypothetical protein
MAVFGEVTEVPGMSVMHREGSREAGKTLGTTRESARESPVWLSGNHFTSISRDFHESLARSLICPVTDGMVQHVVWAVVVKV